MQMPDSPAVLEEVTNIQSGVASTPSKLPAPPPPPPELPPMPEDPAPLAPTTTVDPTLLTPTTTVDPTLLTRLGGLYARAQAVGALPLVATWAIFVLYAFTTLTLLVETTLSVSLLAIAYFSVQSALGKPAAPRPPLTTIDLESVLPMTDIVWALNTVRSAYEAAIEGQHPKAALATAVGFWLSANVLAFVSFPTLLFVAANLGCIGHIICQHEDASAFVGAKRDWALQHQLVQRATTSLASLKDAWPLVALVGILFWAYFLGWRHKVLTLVLGVLVVNASGAASKAGVQKGVQELQNGLKQARRMTISAWDAYKGTPVKSKAL